MKKGTLRWGTAAAGVAILLLLRFLLFHTDLVIPPADEPESAPRAKGRDAVSDAPGTGPAVPAPGTMVEESSKPPASPAPEKPPPRRVVVEGKVIGLGDEPVAGVSVFLLFPNQADVEAVVAQGAFIADPRAAPEGSDDVFSLMGDGTTSREDGTFSIETSPRRRAGLIAWGGAYANTFVEPFSLEENVKGLVLRMEPAVAVSGRVLEAVGVHLHGRAPVPLEGVAVALLQSVPGGRWIHLRTEITDAQGRFRSWGWAPGRYDLLAGKEGLRRSLLRGVEIPADGVEIRMSPGATAWLSGTVFLPGGTTPASGVLVKATTRLGGILLDGAGEASTDSAGKFRIEGLDVPGGGRPCALVAKANGGGRGAAALSMADWTGDSDQVLELVPPPPTVLRLRAVDVSRGAGRAPAAEVRLVLRGGTPDPAGRGAFIVVERRFTTDRSGAAELQGIPDGNLRISTAEDEWEWEFEKYPFPRIADAPSEGLWEVEIEVIPRGRVRGIVIGPGGDPVPGARVEVGQAPGEGAASAAARTGTDGRFTITGVTSKRPFSLLACAPGFRPGQSTAVSLEPGSTLEGIVIRLPVALAAIHGRVVDEEGNPRPEVLVRAHPAEDGRGLTPVSCWTGAGGRYRIEVPVGTAWTVGVEMKGFVWAPTAALLPGDPVPDLVLKPLPEAK